MHLHYTRAVHSLFERHTVSKNGQAKVLSTDEFNQVLESIKRHRYPKKNTLIVQLIFKLGFRAQELSLLRIREVANLGTEFPRGYQVKDVLVLPKRFTKGARATSNASDHRQQRTSVRFDLQAFDSVVAQIARDAKSGITIDAANYYPDVKPKTGGKTRELPITDTDLILSIEDYLDERMLAARKLRANDPLILSQKGGAYIPNTLQGHISKMLRLWSGIDRASSHSGRRTLATKLLRDQKEPIAVVQELLGHKSPGTTAIYHHVSEEDVRSALSRVGRQYNEKSRRKA